MITSIGPDRLDPFWDAVEECHFDYDGNPISLRQWCYLVESRERIIAQDHVGDYFLSTVWIGLDHSWGEGPPIIFETMLFKGAEGDMECWRYESWEQAVAGHRGTLHDLELIVSATT